MKTPFLGESYVAYSQALAANRLVNLYPEVATPGAKDAGAFYMCPGLLTKATIGTGPVRGMRTVGAYLYAVSGDTLYRVDSGWSSTSLGTVSGSGPVCLNDNGTQIVTAANPNLFVYNTSTQGFAQVTDPDFPGAVMVDYLDGYFIFNEPDSQKFWITSLLDGTAIDPLDFASAEGSPDTLVTLIVDHRELWLFGSKSTEVFYNSGNGTFPIERMQGGFIEHGCIAARSVAKMDNSVFWLGNDETGPGIVWRANGYTPERVSKHGMENAIRNYDDMSDAIAYAYQEQGHSFYVLTFPTDQATWVYDASSKRWHERAYFDPYYAAYRRHRSNCYAYFNGCHMVGDFSNGNIYSLDQDTYTDNGDPLKWTRSWRPGFNDKSHDELRLDMEVGTGLVTGQGSDPQVSLRVSDDGGYNWGREIFRGMGPIGARRQRVRWTRLGSPKRPHDRVYEISGTEPVKTALVAAELDVS